MPKAKRPLVVVTRKLPDSVETRMRELFDTQLNVEDKPMTPDQLAAAMRSADVLVPTVTDRIDASVLKEAGPNLKLIANFGNGVDHIDVQAAMRRGITVTNTPGVLTDDTADMTIALILAVARRIVEGAQVIPAGDWSGWSPTWMLGRRLGGKRLGIIGMGRIGQAVALRAQGFRMPVLYTSRRPCSPPPGMTTWTHRPLEEVLTEADFLSLHVPLSETTRHLIGSRELARMKSTAFLINTSRGPVVDEAALLAALRQGTIAGAGLDVYEREPVILSGLEHCSNAVLLPHLGSATHEARGGMVQLACDNLVAVLSGRPPVTPVNSLR